MFIERMPPDGDKEEFDWRFIPTGIAFVAAFWGAYALIVVGAVASYRALFLQVRGVPVYVELTVAACCFLLAIIVFELRDLRNWRLVAWLQILISIVGGVVALFGSDLSISGVVSCVAATFSAANGFKRLYDIAAAESKASAS